MSACATHAKAMAPLRRYDPPQILDLARQAAVACKGDVEVRPFQSE